MDQSLEDIIKQQRGGQRGRGRGRGGFRGRGASAGGFGRGGRGFGLNKARAISNLTRRPLRAPQSQWQHDRFDNFEENGTSGGKFLRSGSVGGASATTKLLISNLDFGVSDSDVKELFGEFGPLRRAAVHYDKSGRSLGSADVVFERKVDAVRAVKQYNNVPLDGRAMKIQLVGANSATAATGSLTVGSRLGTAAGTSRGGFRGSGGRRGFGAGRGGGGGRGRGGSGGGGRQQKESLTAAQLDAELDAYVNKMDSE